MAPQYPSMPSSNQGQPAQNGMGTAALVMGILQFFCLGIIGTILAIVFGKIGMNKAAAGLATNGGAAKAGWILGWIGLALNVLALIGVVIAIAIGDTNTN